MFGLQVKKKAQKAVKPNTVEDSVVASPMDNTVVGATERHISGFKSFLRKVRRSTSMHNVAAQAETPVSSKTPTTPNSNSSSEHSHSHECSSCASCSPPELDLKYRMNENLCNFLTGGPSTPSIHISYTNSEASESVANTPKSSCTCSRQISPKSASSQQRLISSASCSRAEAIKNVECEQTPVTRRRAVAKQIPFETPTIFERSEIQELPDFEENANESRRHTVASASELLCNIKSSVFITPVESTSGSAKSKRTDNKSTLSRLTSRFWKGKSSVRNTPASSAESTFVPEPDDFDGFSDASSLGILQRNSNESLRKFQTLKRRRFSDVSCYKDLKNLIVNVKPINNTQEDQLARFLEKCTISLVAEFEEEINSLKSSRIAILIDVFENGDPCSSFAHSVISTFGIVDEVIRATQAMSVDHFAKVVEIPIADSEVAVFCVLLKHSMAPTASFIRTSSSAAIVYAIDRGFSNFLSGPCFIKQGERLDSEIAEPLLRTVYRELNDSSLTIRLITDNSDDLTHFLAARRKIENEKAAHNVPSQTGFVVV